MSEKKLFLLDGHALVYRAHYAFINRPLINSKGLDTSAITGFVRTLWDLLRNQKPTHLAVVFDPKGGTFRNEQYPLYKANRQEQPEAISIAIPIICDIVKGFNIPIEIIKNFEADDVIGTLAKQAEKEGFKVYMVTPDKDYAQLVSENIFMYKPSRQGNGVDILGIPEVLAKWDIERVDQVIDVLGLQGDSVDNIPGVPGVGAKTAVKLLKIYGSMENILENVEDLKGKQKENFINFREQAILSKQLATINLEVPVKFDAKQYLVEPVNREVLTQLFKDLEFRTLAKQVLGDHQPKAVQQDLFSTGSSKSADTPKTDSTADQSYHVVDSNIENTKHHYTLINTIESAKTLATTLSKEKIISFDTETTGIDAHSASLVGMAFSIKKAEAYYVAVPVDKEQAKAYVEIFKGILEDDKIQKIGQNIKYDINIMRWAGVDIKGYLHDTMIAHYLCEPDLRHNLDYLSESILKYKMVSITSLIGKKGKNQLSMRDIDPVKVAEYAGEDADITLQVKDKIFPKLKEQKLRKLYDEIEEPLIHVLSKMECNGVKINADFLGEYSKVLGAKIQEMEQSIHRKAGVHFNIASPKQVGEVLFDRLQIPYRWRKTASGTYSTDVEKLTELSEKNDIVKDILEFRKLSKLKSTYVDSLPLLINERSGLIHSSFNQARAATGRLSSENPNLQNIPIKNDAGREIRKAFIPRDDEHILMAADYSQIELRLIADISKDTFMMEAFVAGNDFHRATAAKVYNVPYEEVTPEQRRNAKTVNFSITYGAGSTNLSKQLGISRGEAKDLIDNYFTQFSGLKKYMDETVEYAREHGYVKTLLGRKRGLRDINSRNQLARSNSERMAINTPIQGTAADMIKIAMIEIQKALEENNCKSKMIMQVHDELVFDVYKPELDQIKELVETKMKNALPDLDVPIVVEAGIGNNWLEAH